MQTNDSEKKSVERVLASEVAIGLPFGLRANKSASLRYEKTSEAMTNAKTNFGNFSQTIFNDGACDWPPSPFVER